MQKKKLNILVVDDDKDNALSIADLFAADDHHVSVAYNGEMAVAAFAKQDFDLGFFDVMMPGKNGVDSFLEIRQSRPGAKVYFMTGYSDADLLKRAMQGGAKGVFSKPADPAKLLNIVDKEAA